MHGILERGRHPNGTSRVTAAVVLNQKAKTLQPRIRSMVEDGSRVFTDALASYDGLSDKFAHDTVEHAAGQYVKEGDVHTNCMENFWALLKRALKGTYVAVTPKHLERYVDEEIFSDSTSGTRQMPVALRMRCGALLGSGCSTGSLCKSEPHVWIIVRWYWRF